MKKAYLFICALTLSGCSTVDPILFKRSSIAFNPNPNQGGISVWNSDLSAAIENKNGQICMQRAMTAKSFNKEAEVRISDSILKLSQKIAESPQKDTQDLIRFQNEVKETLAVLTTTTERTAYLDIGLFYICQISMNKNLEPPQTMELINQLIKESSQIGLQKIQ